MRTAPPPILDANELRTRKAQLRAETLARRDALPTSVRAEYSAQLTSRLLALPAWRSANCVLAYASIGSEFDSGAFLTAVLDSGKSLVLPRVNRQLWQLDLYRVDDVAADLVSGTWGILEPNPERCVLAVKEAIDFALLPGVAFTVGGERLGYGGGFYDRLLIAWQPRSALMVAAAFAVQMVSELPSAERDMAVDLVLVEPDLDFPLS